MHLVVAPVPSDDMEMLRRLLPVSCCLKPNGHTTMCCCLLHLKQRGLTYRFLRLVHNVLISQQKGCFTSPILLPQWAADHRHLLRMSQIHPSIHFDADISCCVNSFALLVCSGSRNASSRCVSILTAEARRTQQFRDWTAITHWASPFAGTGHCDIKNVLKRLRRNKIMKRVILCTDNRSVELFGPHSRVVRLPESEFAVLGLLRSAFPTSTTSNKLATVVHTRGKLLYIPEASGTQLGLKPMLPKGTTSDPSLRMKVKDIEDRIRMSAPGCNNATLCASGLMSIGTAYQCPHIDFFHDELRSLQPLIAFLPLCAQGMFLHVWPVKGGKGLVSFVPFGNILILDANTVHAGVFKIPGSLSHRIQIKIYPKGVFVKAKGNCHEDEFGNDLSQIHLHDTEVVDHLLQLRVLELG